MRSFSVPQLFQLRRASNLYETWADDDKPCQEHFVGLVTCRPFPFVAQSCPNLERSDNHARLQRRIADAYTWIYLGAEKVCEGGLTNVQPYQQCSNQFHR